MPRWDFKCNKCGQIVRDVISHIFDSSAAAPDCCGGKTVEYWDNCHLEAKVFEPFQIQDLDESGHRITINSSSELKEYCSRNVLVHVDDPGLQMEGGQLVRKKSNPNRVYFT